MVLSLKRSLSVISILISWLITAQSDPAYQGNLNQQHTGNLSETGINNSKINHRKFKEIDSAIQEIDTPSGWNKLLKNADNQIRIDKIEKQKHDSIEKEHVAQKEAIFLKQQKANTFKNQMLGLMFGLICFILIYFIIKWAVREAKKKSQGNSINLMFSTIMLKSLSRKEMLFFSIALGLVFSIVSGSLFSKTKYYSLYKGQSVEVSKSLSTFELQEFNFLLSIIVFLVSVCLFYGIWHFKNQNVKS